MQAAEVAESLGIPEVIVPPYPGHHLRDGPADERPQVRPDAHRLHDRGRDRRASGSTATSRRRRRSSAAACGRTASPADEIEVAAGLDCRYVGQGYELRIPLPEERFTQDALDEFHRLHEQEYGHAFRDPIEIVNLRVTAYGKRPRIRAAAGASANGGNPLLGEGESVFGRTTHPTRYYERSLLPVGESIDGAAVVFQRDTTTVVPPGWMRTADASGSLVLSR